MAQSSDPIANTAIDAVKMRRGPNRSDSQLLKGTRAAIARKYDVRAAFASTGSTPRSRAISGNGVAISVPSSVSIVKAAEIRSGSRRLWAGTAGPSSYAVGRHAITPSVRARTSGDARQEASAS